MTKQKKNRRTKNMLDNQQEGQKFIMIKKEFIKGHWQYYRMLEKRFRKTIKYVELCKNNFKTFSISYAQLLQSIGSELDLVLKKFCWLLGTQDATTIDNYAKCIIEKKPDIVNMKVTVCLGGPTIQPFKGWNTVNPGESLPWWDAFNKMKHNRYEQLKKANLENTFNMLGALFLIEIMCLIEMGGYFADYSKIFSLVEEREEEDYLVVESGLYNDTAVDTEKFWESFKKWIRNDYYTPRFKAEVVFDTLLSEDIEKLLGLICNGKVILLAKEFPISNFNGNNNLGSNAVDYLAYNSDGQEIFFVELKTTDESFNPKQLKEYLKFCGVEIKKYPKEGSKKGWSFPFYFYKKVCNRITEHIYTVSKNGVGNPAEADRKRGERAKIAFDLKNAQKYIFQLAEIYNKIFTDKKFCDEVSDDNWREYRKNKLAAKKNGKDMPNTPIDKVVDEIEDFFCGYKISLVYISMKNITPDFKKVIEKNKTIKKNFGKHIRNNTYNITLVNGEDPKGYLRVCNGYNTLSPELKEIVKEIVKHKIS